MNHSKENNQQNYFEEKEKRTWQKPELSELPISQTAQDDGEPLNPPQRSIS